MIVKPDDVTSSLAYYDDVKEELVQSDMDVLKNRVSNVLELSYLNEIKTMKPNKLRVVIFHT